MTNTPPRSVSECVDDLAALRLASATPAAAAAACATLLEEAVACRSAVTIQQLTLAAARRLSIPTQLPSDARAALLRLHVAPRLVLRRVTAGTNIVAATGNGGSEALWLLTGEAHATTPAGEPIALEPWALLNASVLTGDGRRCYI